MGDIVGSVLKIKTDLAFNQTFGKTCKQNIGRGVRKEHACQFFFDNFLLPRQPITPPAHRK